MCDIPIQQRPTYSPKSSPFLNEVRNLTRLKRTSRRTEASYVHYIVDFIRFQGQRNPPELGVGKIRAYLPYLATSIKTRLPLPRTWLPLFNYLR